MRSHRPSTGSRPRHPARTRGRLLAAAAVLALVTPAAAQTDTGAAGAAPTRLGLVDSPAPEFSLTTTDGEKVSVAGYGGYLLLLTFIPDTGDKGLGVAATTEYFWEAGDQNDVRFLGISPVPPDELAKFRSGERLKAPMAHDPGGKVTEAYLGEPRPAAFLIDARGTVRLFVDRFDRTTRVALLREIKRLVHDQRVDLERRPQVELPWRSRVTMPGFFARDVTGKVHSSPEYAGKPLLLYFFEQDCVHCRDVTPAVRALYNKYQETDLQFVGVVTEMPAGFDTWLRDEGFFFPIFVDPFRRMHEAFGSVQGTPDLFLVDAAGTVRWREFGAPANISDILEVEAAVLLGKTDPGDLLPGKYMGFRYCRVCHEPEFEDWLRTPHAGSMLSLHDDEAFRRQECVSCHVTGFQRPGGFADLADLHLAHVQCEACHGAGGPHAASAQPLPGPDATCLTCHIPPYTLKQSLEKSLDWMDHHDTPSPEVMFAYRPQQIEGVRLRRIATLTSLTFQGKTGYVGSDRCAECHAAEHASWAATPHARALETLAGAGRGTDPECLACHVTGSGLPSGYRGPSNTSLASVGCETCHGPGADHVDAPAEMAAATLYGLAPDCKTCQPEAVCRACHDSKNDPGFRMPADAGAASHPPRP